MTTITIELYIFESLTQRWYKIGAEPKQLTDFDRAKRSKELERRREIFRAHGQPTAIAWNKEDWLKLEKIANALISSADTK